jgi:hypothetical protein
MHTLVKGLLNCKRDVCLCDEATHREREREKNRRTGEWRRCKGLYIEEGKEGGEEIFEEFNDASACFVTGKLLGTLRLESTGFCVRGGNWQNSSWRNSKVLS